MTSPEDCYCGVLGRICSACEYRLASRKQKRDDRERASFGALLPLRLQICITEWIPAHRSRWGAMRPGYWVAYRGWDELHLHGAFRCIHTHRAQYTITRGNDGKTSGIHVIIATPDPVRAAEIFATNESKGSMGGPLTATIVVADSRGNRTTVDVAQEWRAVKPAVKLARETTVFGGPVAETHKPYGSPEELVQDLDLSGIQKGGLVSWQLWARASLPALDRAIESRSHDLLGEHSDPHPPIACVSESVHSYVGRYGDAGTLWWRYTV